MAKKGTEFNATITFGGKTMPSLQKAFSTVNKGVAKLDKGINKALKGATLAATAMAAAFAAAAIKVTKDCVTAGAQFEKQMSNVATLLDGNVKGRIEELGNQILDVKRVTKKPIEDLTNGAYQIISAFGDAPDTAKKLEISAKAAKAGVAETLDAVNLFSAQMKGYGNTSAEFMQQCADMNFQVVKLGQTTFPELAAALPSVVPLAKMMGVTIQEVNGYMATMTGVTGNASEVSTQLASALTALLKPSKEMTKKIKALGFADGQAMIKARGLQGSLEVLRKTVKSDIEFGKLFGRKEGINFALAATGNLADTVRQKTKAMYEATGSAETAFRKQGDNMIAKWTAISNAVEIAQIQIGQKLTPFLKTLAEKLLPHVENGLNLVVAQVNVWVDEWSKWLETVDFAKLKDDILNALSSAQETIKTYIPIIKDWGEKILIAVAAIKACDIATRVYGATMAIIKGLAVAWDVLTAAINLSGKAIGMFGKAMKALKAWHVFVKVATALQWAWNIALNANPIGLIVLAIAALIGIGWLLYDNWDEICAGLKVAWDATCNALSVAWDVIKQGLEISWQWLSTKWNEMVDGISYMWDTTCDDLKLSWEIFKRSVQIAWIWLGEKWDEMVNGISSLWDTTCDKLKGAWDGVKNSFSSAWDGIKNACARAIDWMMDKIQPFLDAWDAVKDGVSGVLSKIGLSDDEPEKKARGGFTHGLSICGEAGTEAVISFDPRYRAQNQGYLMTAAEMLGMFATPAPASREPAHSSTYNFGGITFSPVIKTNGGAASTQSIVAQLRAAIPDLADMLEEEMEKRNAHRYA